MAAAYLGASAKIVPCVGQAVLLASRLPSRLRAPISRTQRKAGRNSPASKQDCLPHGPPYLELPYNVSMLATKRIAILGAGNIGAALIGGILKGGVATRDHLIATVRTSERAEELPAKYAITVTAGGNREAAQAADLIILAVKPVTLPHVLEEIRELLREDQILISLAAAVPIVL